MIRSNFWQSSWGGGQTQRYFCQCLRTIQTSGMDVNIGLKDGPLASPGCGEKQSFVCLWAESRTSFSFVFTVAALLGPQLQSLSPFQGIRKLIIGTKEKIKASKAKTRREEFCMKYNYQRSCYYSHFIVAGLRFMLAEQLLHWSFGLAWWVWELRREVSRKNQGAGPHLTCGPAIQPLLPGQTCFLDNEDRTLLCPHQGPSGP